MSRPAPTDADEACDGAREENDTPTPVRPSYAASLDSDLGHHDAAVRPAAFETSSNVYKTSLLCKCITRTTVSPSSSSMLYR